MSAAAARDSIDIARAARRFGVALRATECELITALLSGRDAVGGNVDCYRLAALFLPSMTVVIVSSVVEAEYVHFDTGKAPLVYVEPWRFVSEDCVALLRRNGVSLVVIGEGCASGAIGGVVARLGRPPILALGDETGLGLRAPFRSLP